jgi:hypothetical protein
MERRLNCVLCERDRLDGSPTVVTEGSATLLKPVCPVCRQRLAWVVSLELGVWYGVMSMLVTAIAGSVMFVTGAQVSPTALKWAFVASPILAAAGFLCLGRFRFVALWVCLCGAVAILGCLQWVFGQKIDPNSGSGLVAGGLLIAAFASLGLQALSLIVAFAEALTKPESSQESTR